jgi:hypothetical protein
MTIPDPGGYAALDDRELWRLMSQRDTLAFGALFDRHLRAVCNPVTNTRRLTYAGTHLLKFTEYAPLSGPPPPGAITV